AVARTSPTRSGSVLTLGIRTSSSNSCTCASFAASRSAFHVLSVIVISCQQVRKVRCLRPSSQIACQSQRVTAVAYHECEHGAVSTGTTATGAFDKVADRQPRTDVRGAINGERARVHDHD